MGITQASAQDPVWDTAWDWVTRQHQAATLDDEAARDLAAWLAADPRHRVVFDQATRLWFAAGFVPPEHPVDMPDAPGPR